ncbi:hypothetical protein FEP63_05431 [Burkholderia multivorans]|nr:hypothetical protein [Burkholderia multivorans]MDR8884249.1 hypothetical protein [Burkholderia multivorans]MDR8889747.1 hypothetical protein [Burkholderia multivorans]MDR8896575.1 hypothetical protein [Burkholderia multivorans]MDR8902913.1 hypothetical protein [Burkholderia multivorans]
MMPAGIALFTAAHSGASVPQLELMVGQQHQLEPRAPRVRAAVAQLCNVSAGIGLDLCGLVGVAIDRHAS